jgi:hypothetical protein
MPAPIAAKKAISTKKVKPPTKASLTLPKQLGKVKRVEFELFTQKEIKLAYAIVTACIYDAAAKKTNIPIPGGTMKYCIGTHRHAGEQVLRTKFRPSVALLTHAITRKEADAAIERARLLIAGYERTAGQVTKGVASKAVEKLLQRYRNIALRMVVLSKAVDELLLGKNKDETTPVEKKDSAKATKKSTDKAKSETETKKPKAKAEAKSVAKKPAKNKPVEDDSDLELEPETTKSAKKSIKKTEPKTEDFNDDINENDLENLDETVDDTDPDDFNFDD